MNLLHQATVINMSLVKLVVAAVSQQYIVILMLNVTLSDMQNKSVLSLALLLCIDRATVAEPGVAVATTDLSLATLLAIRPDFKPPVQQP